MEQALGVPLASLQGTFDQALDARFGALRAALRAVPGASDPAGQRGARGSSAPPDPAALAAAAAAYPGSYAAQMAYGQALAAAGDRAAFGPLEKAAALVPVTSGEDSPHAVMARLAEELGDEARAMAEYQAVLAQDHTTVSAARRLAALAGKAGGAGPLTLAYERIVAVDPFDPAAHAGLGRLAIAAGQVQTAVREFRAALALKPADRAAAHCDLAEAYLAARRPGEAKSEALAALEIAPSYDRAQELLLRAIQGTGPGAPPVAPS